MHTIRPRTDTHRSMTDPGGPTGRSLVVTLAALVALGWAALNPVAALVGVLALGVLVGVVGIVARAFSEFGTRVCRLSRGPLLATVCRRVPTAADGSCAEKCRA